MTRKKKKVEQAAEAPEQPVEAGRGTEAEEVAEAVEPGSEAPGEAEEAPEPELTVEQRLTLERDDYKDRWLRAVAEQDNVRKRSRREVGDARRFAVVELMRELLEVLDNFERAAASAAANGGDDEGARRLRSGLELIHDRFREILDGRGLEPVPAEKGQAFDPAIHEAVMRLESEDVAPGEIVDVAQKGYRLDDIVLRPARVVVAQ
jgi:molecular chaperone GrpE